MSTKTKILELLENNRGKSLSGEEMANILGVSRAAVWKAVKVLQKDGHEISAVPNRGYMLSIDSRILSVQGLIPFLSSPAFSAKIHLYKTLESTNKTAKEMAVNGYEHGTVIIADTQTHGKGRYGRSFYSPAGSGLYMSFILRVKQVPTLITAAAAVIVCRAVYAVTGKIAEIKWVNDVLLDGKKISGILTEAVTDIESGGIDWLVLGIGININTSDFPDELSGKVASILDTADATTRSRLAADIINSILSSDTWHNDITVYDEYKSKMAILGQKITVIQTDDTYEAVAVDIDEQCRLIVKRDDGTFVTLSSGEVSIKL